MLNKNKLKLLQTIKKALPFIKKSKAGSLDFTTIFNDDVYLLEGAHLGEDGQRTLVIFNDGEVAYRNYGATKKELLLKAVEEISNF